MYLTTIEHGGRYWSVELKALQENQITGPLEFSFVQSPPAQQDLHYTREVPSEVVDVLHLAGEVNEEVLREQLSHAIAAAGSPNPKG